MNVSRPPPRHRRGREGARLPSRRGRGRGGRRVPMRRRGQAIVAFVTLKGGEEGPVEKLEELRNHVARRSGRSPSPRTSSSRPRYRRRAAARSCAACSATWPSTGRCGDTTTLADASIVSRNAARRSGTRTNARARSSLCRRYGVTSDAPARHGAPARGDACADRLGTGGRRERLGGAERRSSAARPECLGQHPPSPTPSGARSSATCPRRSSTGRRFSCSRSRAAGRRSPFPTSRRRSTRAVTRAGSARGSSGRL